MVFFCLVVFLLVISEHLRKIEVFTINFPDVFPSSDCNGNETVFPLRYFYDMLEA